MNEIKQLFADYGLESSYDIEFPTLTECYPYFHKGVENPKKEIFKRALISSVGANVDLFIVDVSKFREKFNLSEEWLFLNRSFLNKFPLALAPKGQLVLQHSTDSITRAFSFASTHNTLDKIDPTYALKKTFSTPSIKEKKDSINRVELFLEKLSTELASTNLQPLQKEILSITLKRHDEHIRTIRSITNF